MNSEFGHEST